MNRSWIRPILVYVSVSLLIAVIHITGLFWPAVSSWEGTLIGMVFIVAAMYAARKARMSDRELGLVVRPVIKTLVPSLVASVLIFPVFGVGYIAWMRLQGHRIRVPAAPLSLFQPDLLGAPNHLGKHTVFYILGTDLQIKTQTPLIVHGRGCKPPPVNTLVRGHAVIDLHRCKGVSISADRYGPGKDKPVKKLTIRRSWWNLFMLLLIEVFGVALPEELFYRGYLQGALRKAFTHRLRFLGVDLGWEVVVASALFALGHLITIPQGFRLAVFFPSLVFGYLKERSNSLVSPIIFHALSNCVMFIMQGFTGHV